MVFTYVDEKYKKLTKKELNENRPEILMGFYLEKSRENKTF